MREKFQKQLNDLTGRPSGWRILVAVSGGLDSMTLCELMRQSGYEWAVAHCNFQLRGEESNEDEVFVKQYCETIGIPFFTKRFDTARYSEAHHISVQMAARELRYNWFEQVAEQESFDFIATAHHLSDSLETLLINIVRGTGWNGLMGISGKKGRVIRPLLFASREEIKIFASQHILLWREDSSNQMDHYQRNFIRHRIMPLLKELNPSLEHTFHSSESKLAGASEMMQMGLSHWQQQFVTSSTDQVIIHKQGFAGLHFPAIILWYVVKPFGFNASQCEDVIRSLGSQPGKCFYSPGYKLILDRSELIIQPLIDTTEATFISMGQQKARLGKMALDIREDENVHLISEEDTAQVDAEGVTFPLVWRKWEPGDYFYPLGLGHRKKISDFLIDQKVSMADKEKISVIVSAGEIIWLAGLRIDDRYRVKEDTKKVFRFRIEMIPERQS